MNAGARGVIDYSYGTSELTDIIRNVRAGRRFMPADVKCLVDTNDFELSPEKYKDFTMKQFAVMQLAAEGLSNMEIAFNLKISVKSVEKHKKKIRDKLGLLSSFEIGLFAIREGFVEVKEVACL